MKKKLYLLIGAVAMCFASCSNFLEEYSQDTAYVRGYEDLDELLLGACYMPVVSPSHFGIALGDLGLTTDADDDYYYPYIHLLADEVGENITDGGDVSIRNGDARDRFFGYYTWQQRVGIDPLGTSFRDESFDWRRIYKHINVANMIIAEVDKQTAETEEDQLEVARIKGEAYFLRAAYYFTLVNLYGKPYTEASAATDLGVPVKTSEFVEDMAYSRNTVEEVYEQVLADLTEAERLLSQTTRKSIYRADITATYLLQSRVYLYMQNWEQAAAYAQKAIEKQPALQDLNQMGEFTYFLDPEMPEVIFTMGTGGLRESITGAIMDFGITEELYNAYKPNDLRREYFIKDNGNFYEYVKGGARADLSRSSLSSNFCFRTAEAYLNLAEASAYMGEESDARDALNHLRGYRLDASQYEDVTATGADLITEIREERQRELCLEGHRWFDLRRYMVCEVQPYAKPIRHSYSTFEEIYNPGSWSYEWVAVQTNVYELEPNDDAYTLPIPREVLDYNIGMQNNERGARPIVETINY